MKRIGVTSRVDFLTDRNEYREAVDQALVKLINSLDFMPVVLSNAVSDANEYISSLSLDGLVLSGGNDLTSIVNGTNQSPERDKLESTAIDYCCNHNLPVFGVCRGLQMINCHFGGTLSAIEDHAGNRHTVIKTDNAPNILEPSFEVNSFHNFGVLKHDLASKLLPWATTTDSQSIEAFRHTDLPIAAVMWHPERETPIAKRDSDLLNAVLNGVVP